MNAALQERVEVSGFIFPPADSPKFFLLVCTLPILKQAQEHGEALDGILFRTNASSGGQEYCSREQQYMVVSALPFSVTLLLAGSPYCRYD